MGREEAGRGRRHEAGGVTVTRRGHWSPMGRGERGSRATKKCNSAAKIIAKKFAYLRENDYLCTIFKLPFCVLIWREEKGKQCTLCKGFPIVLFRPQFRF